MNDDERDESQNVTELVRSARDDIERPARRMLRTVSRETAALFEQHEALAVRRLGELRVFGLPGPWDPPLVMKSGWSESGGDRS